MSLKIEDETVYVIYYEGKPYQESGCKLVYTATSGANGVITREAKHKAEHRYDLMTKLLPDRRYWYELDRDVRTKMIEEVKSEFSIVEYGPKNSR